MNTGDLWVGLNLKVVVAQVALHPELQDGRGVVVAHFGLLRVVADAHADVGATPIAPDVERELKPGRST